MFRPTWNYRPAATTPDATHTRFWFTPKDRARLLQRDGVFIIRRLDIAVRTETVGPAVSDVPASQFAAALETAFPDVAATRAELAFGSNRRSTSLHWPPPSSR